MKSILAIGVVSVAAALLCIPLAFAPGDAPAASPEGAGIPGVVLAAYQRAASTCSGLRWELLAGVGQVESAHGTSGGGSVGPDGVASPPIFGPPLNGSGVGGNTTAMPVGRWRGRWGLVGPWLRAVGPMQFLPATFEAWAADGDENGATDPHDIDDAAATAAAYLCGPGGEVTDERAAIRRYNASDAYVDAVLDSASRYEAVPPLAVGSGDVAALLADPNVTIYSGGRADLVTGRIDGRVVALLLSLAADHTITVTSLVTGHPRCAVNGQAHGPGCGVSNHYLGRAADVAVLDGLPISARHPLAATVMSQLAALEAPYRPDEIGGPVDTGEPGVFSNSYHSDHLHFGYDG